MILQMHLIWFLCTMLAGSSGQTIVVTQTPESLTVLPEETVTIQCKASRSVGNEMNLYLLQPGETPKLMLYHVTNRFTGVPDRFSGRYSGTDFTFTISGVQVEDAGDYCCGHDYGVPLTVIQPHTKTCSVSQQAEHESE
uniref:Ig-like domain-containing protein n=1 Tax=Sphenodon punctatus TaxID=8508 RepID=A0A8D0L4N4_SPHPU